MFRQFPRRGEDFAQASVFSRRNLSDPGEGRRASSQPGVLFEREEMPIRLFHRTTCEGVPSILADGFRDEDDVGVWFSQYLDCWGERGGHLLEVMLDIAPDELAAYVVKGQADEEWSDTVGDFVRSENEDEIERFVWYKIPAELVNRRGRVLQITSSEEKLEISYGLDSLSTDTES